MTAEKRAAAKNTAADKAAADKSAKAKSAKPGAAAGTPEITKVPPCPDLNAPQVAELVVQDYTQNRFQHSEQDKHTYGEMMMAGHEALRHQLFTEMVERIPQQARSVPYVRRCYRYQSRYEEGNKYAVYTR